MDASSARSTAKHATLESIVMSRINDAALMRQTSVDLRGLTDQYPAYPQEIDPLKELLRRRGYKIVAESPKQENWDGQLIISWDKSLN